MKRLLTPELFVLIALSAVSHFWRLFTPAGLVFDEVYFARFAGHYLAHTFYYDVHPPLANLLYAVMARIAGIPADVLLGGGPAPALRVLPAVSGALIAPLGYVLLKQLGAARRVAFLAGVALVFENALTVDSRFALVEPLIICAGLGALAVFLTARASVGGARWVLIAVSAVLAGAAISFKWTGASALGLMLAR
jgi:dolichyl-phosphate-mannose-protein mannosyltransferase